MSELKNKTVNSVFWSSIERYSVQGVQFILGLIMARLLCPHDYGLIAMLAIFMSISQIFIDGGFSTALIQKENRTENDFSTAFYINVSMSCFFYFLLFLSAPWIAAFYLQPILTPITRIYSLNLIINSIVSINKTKLSISLDFKTQSKISFFSALLSGLVGVSCAFNGLSVWALVIQMLLSAVMNMIFCFYYVRWFPKLIFSKDSFHSLFSFGSKLLIAQLISTIYSNIYTLLIGKNFSSANLGYYSRADQFCNYANNNVAGVLSRVAFPVLSQLQNDNEKLLAAYKKYIKVSAFLVFPVICGLCGVAKPFIILLLTEKWEGSILLLQILCFAYIFDCIVSINLNLIYVKGKSNYILKLEVAKKVIAFSILFISLFGGIVGICVGRAVYSLIALYMNTYYTKKILNYGFVVQFRELFPYLCTSLLVLGESLFFSYWVLNPFFSLCISFIVCSVSYVFICSSFGFSAYIEVKNILLEKCKHWLV